MLLHRHQLYAVVAAFLDVGEDIVSELAVLGHTAMLRTHAHMSLIDLQVLGNCTDTSILKLVGGLEVYGIKKPGLVILDDVASPSRVSVHL